MSTRTTAKWEPWMAVLIALTEDGMTQEELAQRLGWDPSKLSRIIAGVKHRGGKRQELKGSEIMRIAEIQDRPYSWYLEGYIEGSGDAKGVYLSSLSRFEWDPVAFAESYADTRDFFREADRKAA